MMMMGRMRVRRLPIRWSRVWVARALAVGSSVPIPNLGRR
jgi:hypothetical protein